MISGIYFCCMEITVNKKKVYDEVAKSTSYTGAKMAGDELAYERIFTTDEDQLMLERFWMECCNDATNEFRPFITSVTEQGDSGVISLGNNYTATLALPSSFDENLIPSMQNSLFSYFVNSISGKWYKMTNKEEYDSYLKDAHTNLMDVRSKLYYRKKPTRKKIV